MAPKKSLNENRNGTESVLVRAGISGPSTAANLHRKFTPQAGSIFARTMPPANLA
jgi:hypothetical protein